MEQRFDLGGSSGIRVRMREKGDRAIRIVLGLARRHVFEISRRGREVIQVNRCNAPPVDRMGARETG